MSGFWVDASTAPGRETDRIALSNCGLGHLQNQTFCGNLIFPGSCPASGDVLKQVTGPLSCLLYWPTLHSSSQWPSILSHGLLYQEVQCSPKCPILPLYQRCSALIRFPVGPSGYSWDILKPRNLLWYNFVSNKMYNRLLKLLFSIMWQKEGLSYDVEYAGFKLHTSTKLLCNNGERI